jgi:hypothetical protein
MGRGSRIATQSRCGRSGRERINFKDRSTPGGKVRIEAYW